VTTYADGRDRSAAKLRLAKAAAGMAIDRETHERRARMVDPEAWQPPFSREKDLRRLAARDRVRNIMQKDGR
jgi:hypothetical protein